ncbi:hypothetical protein [Mycobacterium tuberculosis]|uniref:hypothetical protein n=1 Tax=Mycobacterium tuberculosis TaxID=1773 RepID=UPI00272AF0DE|nr:hypothetical protein [Mycobacterium tuberculosis]
MKALLQNLFTIQPQLNQHTAQSLRSLGVRPLVLLGNNQLIFHLIVPGWHVKALLQNLFTIQPQLNQHTAQSLRSNRRRGGHDNLRLTMSRLPRAIAVVACGTDVDESSAARTAVLRRRTVEG